MELKPPGIKADKKELKAAGIKAAGKKITNKCLR